MENKIKMVEAIEKVIAVLENNSVTYNWREQKACNCGLIAQTITRTVGNTLEEKYLREGFSYIRNQKKRQGTWSMLAQEYCPISGEPFLEIFKIFYQNGFNREDIFHLEYLSNKKILSKTDIDVNEKKYIDKTIEKEEVVEIERKGFLNRFFNGKMVTKKIKVPKIIQEVDSKYLYYADPVNLLKYLKAWVEILKEEMNTLPDSKINFITIDKVKYGYESKEELIAIMTTFINKDEFEKARIVQKEISKVFFSEKEKSESI